VTYVSELVNGICLDGEVVLFKFLFDLVETFRNVLGLQDKQHHSTKYSSHKITDDIS